MKSLLTAALLWLACAEPADALLCHAILGCTCDVTAADIRFTDFSPLGGTAQSAEGQITVDCTGIAELSPTIVVKLDRGLYGTIPARKMRAASGDLLDYNIYHTSQPTTVWGDLTGGTPVTVSGGLLALGHWQVSRAVNAIAAPTTTTKPGSYSDTITVRIDW